MLSLIYPYYRQPKMLEFQIENALKWPQEIKDNINFILVDDGSPEPMMHPSVELNIESYRINENIAWNVGGARNLAAEICQTDWMWLGYIDYLWDEENIKKLLLLDMTDKNTFYRFLCLRSDNKTPQHPEHHPIGSPLLNKSTFWKQGGLDEDFSAYYGAEDCAMYWQLTRDPGGCKEVILESPFMWCYTASNGPKDSIIVPESHNEEFNTGWSRNNSRNRQLLGDKRQKKIPWSRDYLRFTWQKTGESYAR